ncbi:MAG: hypothetical protein ACK5UX_08055, partial [Burkholderiales bacterium]
MKKSWFSLTLIGALLTSLAAALFGGALWAQRERPIEPRSVTPRGALLEAERAMIGLFDATAPSVAYITTESEYRYGWFGEQVGVAQGAGSGFVWDNQGHI